MFRKLVILKLIKPFVSATAEPYSGKKLKIRQKRGHVGTGIDALLRLSST